MTGDCAYSGTLSSGCLDVEAGDLHDFFGCARWVHSGEIFTGSLQLTGERRRGFDLLRAKPAAPQWPVAHNFGCFFQVSKAKASTVPEEHVADPRYFVRHVPGSGGSQPKGRD